MMVEGVGCGGRSLLVEVIVEHQGIFDIHHRLMIGGVIQLGYCVGCNIMII